MSAVEALVRRLSDWWARFAPVIEPAPPIPGCPCDDCTEVAR